MNQCDYGGTHLNGKDYKDACFLPATTYLKFYKGGDNPYFIIPYCHNHAIGYEHIKRTTEDNYSKWNIECEVEDVIES